MTHTFRGFNGSEMFPLLSCCLQHSVAALGPLPAARQVIVSTKAHKQRRVASWFSSFLGLHLRAWPIGIHVSVVEVDLTTTTSSQWAPVVGLSFSHNLLRMCNQLENTRIWYVQI